LLARVLPCPTRFSPNGKTKFSSISAPLSRGSAQGRADAPTVSIRDKTSQDLFAGDANQMAASFLDINAFFLRFILTKLHMSN
jgi:hypothetical protein